MARKILIIENDKTFRVLLSQRLKKEGYEVTETDNGTEGLSLMNELGPDLVLLEMNLPQFTGSDLLGEISKSPVLRNIPIIAILDSRWEADSINVQEIRVKDLLIKTEFDSQELIEKVTEHI